MSTNLEQLQTSFARFPASYKGALFLVSEAEGEGGRKIARKRPMLSDKQVLEDSGGAPVDHTFRGWLAAFGGRSYEDVRDEWLRKVASRGPGRLVHPFRGTFENQVCIKYTINESMADIGVAAITMSFGVSDATGLPTKAPANPFVVVTLSDAASAASLEAMASEFDVPAQNFADAAEQQSAFASAVESASDVLAASQDKINAFKAGLAKHVASIPALLSEPSALADSMGGIYSSIDTLYSDASQSANAAAFGAFDKFRDTQAIYDRLFTFGDFDIPFPLDTFLRQVKQKNRSNVKYSVKASALAKSYANAVQADYATADDIAAASEALDDKLSSIYDLVPTEVREALLEVRAVASEVFDSKSAQARRVTTVRVNRVSTRVLAYRYYGDSELGDDLQQLNGLPEPRVRTGDVKILTV